VTDMANRTHLSIGEVLSLLQDEFPDVTISKIRFLESQGLLDPERTPSGYRKFYEPDVRRLRWILTQQRDHFLPLKVIKDRLDAGEDAELAAPDRAGNGATAAVPPAAGPDGSPSPAPVPGGGAGSDDGAAGGSSSAAGSTGAAPRSGAVPAGATAPATGSPGAGDAAAPDPATDGSAAAGAAAPATPSMPIWMADAARAKADRVRSGHDVGEGPAPLDADVTSVSLTPDELIAASGLTRGQLGSLEEYGLVSGQVVGDERYYGGEDLIVAQKAAGFFGRGLEARHLRMFKTAADREAAMLEQLVLPLVRQRSPEGRAEMQATIAELAGLGQGLRAALLRSALADHLAP